jgi:enoyl-CoA hydratase
MTTTEMTATEQASTATGAAYEHLRVEHHGPVALITLDRPKALNALCDALTIELTDALDATEVNPDIAAVVLTGSAKAFAAGADIKEMQPKSFADVYLEDFITASWERASTVRKPIIAAVAGHALGGGAELAMSCDMIIAADTAKFGQPEITIGILPGAGGTQRLTRAVGKSKAMDMVLTGRTIGAEEAERIGLVARVVPADVLIEEAIGVATKIAGFSRPSTLMAKEAVNAAFEMPLREGLRFERRLFHAAFATDGQSEGMAAFLDKRAPTFNNR